MFDLDTKKTWLEEMSLKYNLNYKHLYNSINNTMLTKIHSMLGVKKGEYTHYNGKKLAEIPYNGELTPYATDITNYFIEKKSSNKTIWDDIIKNEKEEYFRGHLFNIIFDCLEKEWNTQKRYHSRHKNIIDFQHLPETIAKL